MEPNQDAHGITSRAGPSHVDTTAAASNAITPYPLEFSGSGGEFFRVWIVNVLLTVLTFGFYTPFARRRTAQYFYSHTLVADSPLEFTAQQRKMVLGFVILVLLYVVFQVASDTGQDAVVGAMMLAGAALAPYFWASAMRFRFNATRWRGVRLQFTASWGEVYRASWPVFLIAVAWICVMVTTGSLIPEGDAKPDPAAAFTVLGAILAGFVVTMVCVVRLEFNYKSLAVARGQIGGQPGRWKPVFSDFVRIWLATVGVFVLSVLVVILLMALALGGSIALFTQFKQGGLVAVLIGIAIFVATLFLLFLASAPARAYREARMFQLVWNNIGVSQVARFKCDLRVSGYVWLRIRNVLLTLLTLGFFRPFAMVSEYAMKTHSVTLHVKGGLEQLAGQLAREEGGLGDAIADAAGLDLVG
jgi:uncharacterized membrane protein YjgN (DUF898 family)